MLCAYEETECHQDISVCFSSQPDVGEEVGWWSGNERMGNENENCRIETSPEI
jgi:hypothetical protein